MKRTRLLTSLALAPFSALLLAAQAAAVKHSGSALHPATTELVV